MIVAIGGYARAGKDTFGNQLVSKAQFKRLAFADSLKGALLATDPYVSPDGVRLSDALELTGGWEEIKGSTYGPEVRRLLQKMGTEGMRNHAGDRVWIDALLSKVLKDYHSDFVVTDVRMRDELTAMKEIGAITIWVERPGVGPVNAHVSDNTLRPSDFDFTILNVSTDEAMYNQFLRLLNDSVVK